MKHLLSSGDLSRDDALRILDTADELLAVGRPCWVRIRSAKLVSASPKLEMT